MKISTSFMQENHKSCEKEYNKNLLRPIREFLEVRKINKRLNLSAAEKKNLSDLLQNCIGIRISFEQECLSNLEILDLVISLYVNTSQDRAAILGTSAGFLRNINQNVNFKLKANNRAHALFIAVKKGLIEIL